MPITMNDSQVFEPYERARITFAKLLIAVGRQELWRTMNEAFEHPERIQKEDGEVLVACIVERMKEINEAPREKLEKLIEQMEYFIGSTTPNWPLVEPEHAGFGTSPELAKQVAVDMKFLPPESLD